MARIFNLFPWKRRRLERELDRELRYHVDRRVEDLRRAGMSERQARRTATLELGGVAQAQEEVRDTWVWRWVDDLSRDARYAVRTLLRSPGFTATALLSLALGIGANAAIFSLVDQVLLRSLPVSDPSRLVHVAWRGHSLSNSWGTGNLMSYPMCRDLDEQQQFFEGVFCRHPTTVTLSTGRQHQAVPADIVSGSYFPVLGVQPEAGRLIDQSDDRQPGAHPVVVLSYTYWKHSLGGAQDVVGQKVLVNNAPMTVIGIAPAGFTGVDPLAVPALWIPAMMKRQATPEWDGLLDRRAAWMHAFGRLKPDASVETVSAGLQPWFKSMLRADMQREGFPRATADERRAFLASTIDLLPAAQGLSTVRGVLRRPLLVLMWGTLLLVLLSSLNVASLLLARGAARSREVTTRVALGASRGRITSQLLVEGLLIALVGGLIGLASAPAVTQLLLRYLPAGADLSTRIDYRGFLFALLASLVTGGLCGLAPALQAGRRSLISSMKERSSGGAGGAVPIRKAIVVAQLAFTLVLLIGAGLFVQTLERLRTRDLGFARSNLLMFRLEPDAIGYSASDAPEFMHNLLGRLRDVPVVEHAAVANSSMLTGGSPRRVLTIEADRRIVTDRSLPIMRVGPGFFATLGTPVIAGREFNDADTRDVEKAGYRAVIVNESFARRYFGSRRAIGRRVGVGNQPDTITSIEIVGVVKDISFRFVRADDEPEHVFFPFAQTGPLAGNGTFYLKVRGEPESAFPSIRGAVEEVDARLPLADLTTLDDRIDRALSSERMLATLSSAFGSTALLLSIVGLYGVMSFVVTHRTQEIGVRLALGATRGAAVWLVVRDALIMIGAGTAIALPCAWALRRLVEAELFGVSAFDSPTIALASGLLAAVALSAAMIPAWRAASVSPTEALRLE
jgi:predicted permease